MRILFLALLSACAASAAAATPLDNMPAETPSPFPVPRGTAPPPPSESESTQTAPPEGTASGGVDFGAWRSTNPVAYEASFKAQMRRRFAGKTPNDAKADLESNGFACEQGERLDCRIEITERQCAFDWYVVFEANAVEPAAGFEKECAIRP